MFELSAPSSDETGASKKRNKFNNLQNRPSAYFITLFCVVWCAYVESIHFFRYIFNVPG